MQAIGRQPNPSIRAPDGAPVHYERHRPEQTTLYRLVQQHAATFFEQTESAAGAGLPLFGKDEFDAFLECGILADSFPRLHRSFGPRMVIVPALRQALPLRSPAQRVSITAAPTAGLCGSAHRRAVADSAPCYQSSRHEPASIHEGSTMRSLSNSSALLNPSPQARHEGIHTEPLGDRIIVFDSSTRRSVALDAAGASVWQRCDGETSVAQIAGACGKGEAQVQRELGMLAEAGLLVEGFAVSTGRARRSFLSYGGRAAAFLALIGSVVVAPQAIARGNGKAHEDHGRGHGRGHNKGRGKGHDKGRGKGHAKHHVEDCGGIWSEWGLCSASCAGGVQSRTFTVLTPAANGGAACPVSPETLDCNTQACQAAPVDCDGTWGTYGPCSATCGGGTTARNFIITTPAANGGAACPAPETQFCGNGICALDCVDCDRASDFCDNTGVCIHHCSFNNEGVSNEGDCCEVDLGLWVDDC